MNVADGLSSSSLSLPELAPHRKLTPGRLPRLHRAGPSASLDKSAETHYVVVGKHNIIKPPRMSRINSHWVHTKKVGSLAKGHADGVRLAAPPPNEPHHASPAQGDANYYRMHPSHFETEYLTKDGGVDRHLECPVFWPRLIQSPAHGLGGRPWAACAAQQRLAGLFPACRSRPPRAPIKRRGSPRALQGRQGIAWRRPAWPHARQNRRPMGTICTPHST